MNKRLGTLETAQSTTSEEYDIITVSLKNSKKDIKSLNDKVKQIEERVSAIEGAGMTIWRRLIPLNNMVNKMWVGHGRDYGIPYGLPYSLLQLL